MKRIVVGMHEAKTHFSKLVKMAEAGEEIVVASSGKPVAKIVRYDNVAERTPGLLGGRVTIKAGFEQLPEGFDGAFGV